LIIGIQFLEFGILLEFGFWNLEFPPQAALLFAPGRAAVVADYD